MRKLSERSRKVLCMLIESHIDLNTPIGSSFLKKRYSFGFSAATIRSTMASLESMGYVVQPHTSAGRIPTMRGYEYYVEYLLSSGQMNMNNVLLRNLYNRLRGIQKNLNVMVRETSKTLSLYSKCIGIVTPPKTDQKTLKHIRLVQYEGIKVLSIVIFEDGSIHNSIVNLSREYSQGHLTRIVNYLNDTFAGMTMIEIRRHISEQLSREKEICNRLITSALMICRELIMWESEMFFKDGLTGTSNLPDFVDITHIKEVLRAIEDSQLMLKLIDEVDETKGVQVIVGLDSIIPSLKKMSMVISPYRDKKNAHGTMGIIGPARMNYSHLIPIVSYAAQVLSQVLSES